MIEIREGEELKEEIAACAAQEEERVTSTIVMGVAPDFQAQYKKDLADQALADILKAQGQMDIIHNPRVYTRHQSNLMESVVGVVFGPSRLDIKFAANELTENIALLSELAPRHVSIPVESQKALGKYGTVKFGILEDVRKTGKGYELLALWMNALYEYARHTDQLKTSS